MFIYDFISCGPVPKKKVPICDGVSENGPHRHTGSCTIRKCGLVGIGVALLKEVHFSLLPTDDTDVEFSAPSLTPCLPAHHHSSCFDETETSLN